MTVAFRSRNGLVTIKIESSSGTDATPTPASNAWKVREGWTWTPEFEVQETDEVRSSLDQSEPVIGRGMGRMEIPAFLKGADTAGTAPEAGPGLRCCGLSETLTASAVTGTASAGATGSITLGSYGSSTDSIYVGMVIGTTGGTGSGQLRVISAYDGTSKVATVVPNWTTPPDATTTFSIYANALYVPISTGFETATVYGYDLHSDGSSDSRLRKLVGAAGSLQLSIGQSGALPDLTFNLQGQAVLPADVTKPDAGTFQAAAAKPFLGADVYLGGAALKVSAFSLDLGAEVAAFDDPSATYGFDTFSPTNRQVSGSFTADQTLVSVRNTVSDFIGSTSRSLWLRWGTVAGQRVSLWLPALRYTGNTMGDLRGYRTEQVPFRAPTADGAFYLCIH
ncbi:MAG: hypothetical protein RIB84_23900 [Sneathiellaceae bacterium]